MKYRKVYGIDGMVESQMILRSGTINLHVHFEGGAMTEYGITPAKYTTSNPVYQSIIERSNEFKRGRIQLLRTYELPSVEKEEGIESEEKKEASEKAEEKERDALNKDVLTFETLADARDFLNQKHDVPKAHIRTKGQVMSVGESLGISIQILEQ